MSSMDAYKWHLNLFRVEIKSKKNANEMYSILQNLSEKNWERARKKYEKIRWLQSSWKASGTNFFRLVPDTVLEKNQKLKNEFPKTTCGALEKKLRKKLKLFSTSYLSQYFGKSDQTFYRKKIVKKFSDKKQPQGPCASLVSAQLNFGRKWKR